jgi:hypothetical protein
MKGRTLIVGAMALVLAACAAGHELRYPPSRWIADLDREPIAMPKVHHGYDVLDAFLRPIDQEMREIAGAATGVSRLPMQHVAGLHQEAVDTTNFDEVADSTWFVNRIGRSGPAPAAIREAMQRCGPDTGGALHIEEATKGAAAPVLIAHDRRGARFILDFDPFRQPGFMSAPATVAALILTQAGYPVAPHCAVTIGRAGMMLGEGARELDQYGKARPLTEEAFRAMFARAPQELHGVAIAVPDGIPLGRFSFMGRRFGDKNDRMRHQDRRVLRGLRVFANFIGEVAIGERSGLDLFVGTSEGKGYVAHAIVNLTEVGAMVPPFNPAGVGISPLNDAFFAATPADTFWATRIVAAFDDPLIEAIVAAGHFPDAAAGRAMAEGLKSRRDAIARYWFARMSPLDNCVVAHDEGAVRIMCQDLEVVHGLAPSGERRYRARLATPYNRAILLPWQESAACEFTISREMIASLDAGRAYQLSVQVKGAGEEWWRAPAVLLLTAHDGVLTLAGLERPPR